MHRARTEIAFASSETPAHVQSRQQHRAIKATRSCTCKKRELFRILDISQYCARTNISKSRNIAWCEQSFGAEFMEIFLGCSLGRYVTDFINDSVG